MSVLLDEIYQQPAGIADFFAREGKNVAEIARAVGQGRFDYIFIAARGTSDNAARYGQYLFGMLNRVPVALAAPSLFTVYDAPPRLDRALVIGISQSGQSPDVVSVVEEARRQGAPTIAITNDPASPMAQAADHHIFLGVGEERSVAATKTYTAQLAALATLSLEMAELPEYLDQLRAVPDYIHMTLRTEDRAREAAGLLGKYNRAVVIGRGFNYATACETALKTKELAHVEAEPYSSADFRHGPIALAEEDLPVVLVSAGAAFREELDGLRGELIEHGAKLVYISDCAGSATGKADLNIALPAGLPEWLTPPVAIIPGQLMAYHLTLARGYDPDQPRTISKVTKTF